MDRQQNKTLEISSRRASFFFNFDEKSGLNRDRRPRVPASHNEHTTIIQVNCFCKNQSYHKPKYVGTHYTCLGSRDNMVVKLF